MVKISDFLSTEQRTALQDNIGVQETAKQLNAQSTQAEGQYVDAALQKMAQAQSIARQENIQAIQLKAQEQYQLNNIFSNMQEVGLKTTGVLAAIDETNRRQQENTIASSWVGAKTAELTLGIKQGYKDILSQANPDGSDLFEKVQSFVNTKLAEAEKSAPNGAAIADFKKVGMSMFTQTLGSAIEDADKLRTNYTLNNIQKTINIKADDLRANPKDPTAYEYLQSIGATLKNSKISPLIADEAVKNAAEQLLAAQTDGYVASHEFAGAYDTINGGAFSSVLSDTKKQKMMESVFTAEVEYRKRLKEDVFKAEVATKVFNNQISEFASSKEKEVAGEIALGTFQTLVAGLESRQIDANGFVSGILNYAQQTNRFIPDNLSKAVGDTVMYGQNPETVAYTSRAITQSGKQADTNSLFKSLSSQAKAEAALITGYLNTMPPEEAIKKARFLTREYDEKMAAANVQDGIKQLNNLTDYNIYTDFQLFDDDRGQAQYATEVRAKVRDYLAVNVPYKEALDLAKSDVNAHYVSSSINKNTVMSDKTKYGTATVRYGVEQFYKTTEELSAFRNLFLNKVVDTIGTAGTVDIDNQNIIMTLADGSKQYTPFIVEPVPMQTEYEAQFPNMPKTFRIVNPEKPYEDPIAILKVDDAALKDKSIQQLKDKFSEELKWKEARSTALYKMYGITVEGK